MITANEAMIMSKMTENGRLWIWEAECMIWDAVMFGEASVDLTTLKSETLFPLETKDFPHLLDWFEYLGFKTDREKNLVISTEV